MTTTTKRSRSAVLAALILILTATAVRAQQIDSVFVDRTPGQNQLFLRFRFPDSTYYLDRSLDRTALMFPPVQLLTFYYRSCDSVRSSPLKDTLIPILMPEPYSLLISLVRDTNTSQLGCRYVAQEELSDSMHYSTRATSVPGAGAAKPMFAIFPNPAAEVLHIAAEAGTELSMYDGTGRLLRRQLQSQARATIDLSGITPGIYYLTGVYLGRSLPTLRFTKLP